MVEPAFVHRREHERGGITPQPADGEPAVVEAAELEGVALAFDDLHEADDERAGLRDELHAQGLPGAPRGAEQHEAANIAVNLAAYCGAGAQVQLRMEVLRH